MSSYQWSMTWRLYENEVLVHEDWSQYDCSSACFPVQGTNIGDQYHRKRRCGGWLRPGGRDRGERLHLGCCSTPPLKPILPPRRRIPSWGDPHLGARSVPLQQPGLIAKTFLMCPWRKVRLTVTEIGGGFGGKYEAKASPLLWPSPEGQGRPVKLTYGRDEEFAATVCRSPVHIHMKTGVKRDGTLIKQKVISSGCRRLCHHQSTGWTTTQLCRQRPLKIPNAQVDAYVYMTNKTLGTAYRGFGVTEVATAHERQMDRIAEKLGIDPLELRLKNVLQNGDVGITGEIMQTMAVKECLETAAANIVVGRIHGLLTDEEGNLQGKGTPASTSSPGTLHHLGSGEDEDLHGTGGYRHYSL